MFFPMQNLKRRFKVQPVKLCIYIFMLLFCNLLIDFIKFKNSFPFFLIKCSYELFGGK